MAHPERRSGRQEHDDHLRGQATARKRVTGVRALPQVAAPRNDPSRLQVTAPSCTLLEAIPGQSVGVTYWFDAPIDNVTPSTQVRLVGDLLELRTDATESPSAVHAFDVVHTIPAVPAGVGRVSATMRVTNLVPGTWHIVARPDNAVAFEADGESGAAVVVAESAPGVALGAWAAFVGLGALIGLILFAFQIQKAALPMLSVLTTAIVACLIGLIGAKVYYKAQSTSPTSWLSAGGMCIQGFIVGALAALALGATIAHLPLFRLLDAASAPLLVGIAIGRVGCFRAGCCAGRPSAHRYALWSSDRYLGIRRLPTQLLEGIGALALASIAVAMVNLESTMPPGALLLQSLGGYVLLRQALLPYRALPRREGWRRPLAAAVSASATLIAVGVMAMAAA